MKYEVGDYVLILVETSKALARVEKVKSSSVMVQLNSKALADKNEARGSTIKVDPSNILLNFGTSVPEGQTVMGFRLEPWYGVHHLKRWGRLHWRRFISDEDKQKIIAAFDRVMKEVRKMGLDYKLPIEIEVLPPRGRWAGFYKYVEDELDTMGLTMKEFVQLEYVIWHETGHHVWYRHLDDETRKKWLDLFAGGVQVEEIDAGKLRRMRKDLVEKANLKEFRKELEDSEKVVLKEVLRHIKSVHHMDPDDLQIMLGQEDDLKKIWPKNAMEVSDISLFVSEYARKNVREMFAESLAFYQTGQEMNPTVKKLIKRTMNDLTAKNVVADKQAA